MCHSISILGPIDRKRSRLWNCLTFQKISLDVCRLIAEVLKVILCRIQSVRLIVRFLQPAWRFNLSQQTGERESGVWRRAPRQTHKTLMINRWNESVWWGPWVHKYSKWRGSSLLMNTLNIVYLCVETCIIKRSDFSTSQQYRFESLYLI